MTINNDRKLLEQQILSNSGLKGQELESLKTRLSTLSEQQLQAELSKSLSGGNKEEWYMGVILEHNESVVFKDNYNKITYTDENGNEITEYKDGEDILERIIKSTDDKGNVLETTVTFSGGRPLTQIKTVNGNKTETSKYKYNDYAQVPFMTVETETSDGKKITTDYITDFTDNYDIQKLNRLYQRIEHNGKIHEVHYDGQNNTYVQINAGETAQIMADRINQKRVPGQQAVTAQQIIELNPDLIRKNGEFRLQKFENGFKGLGQVRIPGVYEANSPFIQTRQSVQRANILANNAEYNRQITQRIAENTDKKIATELANNGFKPTIENAIFYERFNALNPSQQQNVLSVIKYCRSQNITDANKIKAKILETFPEINLFDSGKTIPLTNWTTPSYQRKNPVSLETFLTDNLKLNLTSDIGQRVYRELAQKSQAELNLINIQNFGDMSKANFNEIANKFESSGINIRNQFENQAGQVNRTHRIEEFGIPQQKFTSEILANIYNRAADMMEEYYHNHGVFDAGTYLEGFKNIMDWITPDNFFGIDMRNTLHIASDCRKAAQRFRQMHADNPETFKKEYAQLKKDGLVTVDYNRQNVQEFINLLKGGDVDINSDKFKNACQKAFGFKGIENTEKYIQTGQMAGNISDIAIMLWTLGAASELKMVGKITQGVYGALERGAGKIMSKTAAQKTAKLTTSMTMGGTTLGGFTLSKESLNNLSNPMRDATSWETWKETGIATAESFGFGAFGGLLNETVVAPIVKAIERPAAKATQAVSKALTETEELTGKQIMQTVSDSGSINLDGLFKMNTQELANFTRTATAKGVGFGVEVGGFTAYEAALDVIKDLIDPSTGRLPEDMTVESLAKYLGEKFEEQLSNLGTIKGISQLLMMSKGGKVAQKAMINDILSKSESLKNIKFKKAEVDGHEVYEVTYPNGNKAIVTSPEQAIVTCQMAMQMEFLVKSLSEQTEIESKKTPETKQILQGMNEVITDNVDTPLETETKINLKENSPVTIEKAKEMLLDLGFPKSEIDVINFGDNELTNINYIYFLLKENLIDDLKGVNYSSNEAANIRKEVYEFLKEKPNDETKMVNKGNVEELKKYVQCNNIEDIQNVIKGLNNDLFKSHFDDFMRIIPILTKNGTIKMTPEEFADLRWINESDFQYITPERVDFVNKINSQVPEDSKIHINEFEKLGDTETLTDELVSEYVNEVNRFISHKVNDGISLWHTNLVDKIAQMKKISDFLDEFPVELSRDKKGLISSGEVEKLMNRPNIKELQKLLQGMTPQARDAIGVDRLPEADNDIPIEKWKDFFNYISQDRIYFGKEADFHPYEIVDYVNKHNIKDLDGFMDYMEACRDTYAFQYTSIHQNRFFGVENGDYKGAAELLREIKSLSGDHKVYNDFITYNLEGIIHDKNIDFKKALNNIQTLREQGIKVSARPDVWCIVKSTDPKNIVEKFKIMKQSGFEIDHCVEERIFNNPDISPEQLREIISNFEKELTQKFGTDVDIDILRHAALNHESGSTIYQLTSEFGIQDHHWATILNNCKWKIRAENKIFYDKIWNNPKTVFDKRSLSGIANYVNAENTDLAIKICTNKSILKDFSYYGITKLLPKINKENKALVEKLLFDEEINFSKWKLTEILENRNEYALELLNLVCFNDEINFPKDKINFIVGCKISSEISPRVLAEKTKKFFELGFDDNFVRDILENSETLTFYSDEVLKILKQKQIENPEISLKNILKTLVGNIPNKLQDRIDTLIFLAKFTDEEVAVFKKQGVDVNYKMEQLEKLINSKHDLISTTQTDVNTFLKAIANTKAADDAIRNADFGQFGKTGIRLQYSREEFIKRMNELSGGDFTGSIKRAENVEIPPLKMTENDIAKSKEALEEYKIKYANNTKEYEVIIDGKKMKVTRFLGSQRGGSNEGDFAQIGDKLYYIKFPEEAKLEQSVQEVMASELYRAAGIDAPNMKVMFDQDGKILGMASEYIPNIESEAHGSTLFDSFAADAWLANWDAPKHGNSTMRNGTCLKMDVGGSMDYRARGTKKDNFGNIVEELTSLIEQNGDYYTMTKSDVMSSLKHITNITDEQVWKIVENVPVEYRNYSLGQKMIARRDFIRKFEEILEKTDETQYDNILDLVNDVKLQAKREFNGGTDIAALLGYEQTALGFEGLLNTRDLKGLGLKPQELETARKMTAEIEQFTKYNRVSDDTPLPDEAKNFLNGILKGIPEFAAYFSKPQHNGTQYSLDVHILKVLQDCLKDPDYEKLGNQDKIVLKFSALLHDIGKRYLGSNSDTGHAGLSAEYVYSILDRFKLSDDMKDRIISIVENHHWFKDFNNGVIDENTMAALARRPQDWLIYKIMAKADLVNVSEDFAIAHVKGATSIDNLSQAFDKNVAAIEEQVQKLREKQVVITSTKWVEVPGRVTSDGRILEARSFDRETATIDGVESEFKVLNLNKISDTEDMYKYGFNHMLKKALRFIIHMPGDGAVKWFNVFKTLAQNPMNNSAQSMSMISVDDTSTYSGRRFGFILDVDNANVSHAYFSNTSSGTGKGLQNFVKELFENGHHRSYVKDKFIEFLKTERDIDIDDATYAKIMEFIMNKKFPETQLRSEYKIGDKVYRNEDLVIDGKTYKLDDISDAFTYSRDQLIEETQEKTHGSHNEEVGLNAKVKGLFAKVNSFDELPEYFLRFARDNNYPIIIIGSH